MERNGTADEAGVGGEEHGSEGAAPVLAVDRVQALTERELGELAEATAAAIIEGGGFGWVKPQPRDTLARYFQGVLLVPERSLFVARMDGVIVGAAQLVRPPRNNEAQAFSAQLMHFFLAPYARGFGLARLLLRRVEEYAAAIGVRVLNLDVRATQTGAIQLFESGGYRRWGTHPAYALIDGKTIAGHFYYKELSPTGRRARGS
ncbi:GNAT family N-acetyltransferase [Elioraea thermophila]|uniref:GNAT family N-acetyltransferase n=1 Tax=Elioraea thermophila TaxID=2185104 RepID=UPI000DF220C8|nr:GNAT family N-acetyltransferase [Elioraea thermophila]